MTNIKATKRALGSSVLALFLCFAMLLGTTFAWFTDSVTSNNNIITAGNLDVELEYLNKDGSWETVNGSDKIFTEDELWEPGYTKVVYLKLTNKGTLDFKYQLGVNINSETAGTNKAGDIFKLSDYIYFDVVEGIDGKTEAYADRTAVDAVKTEKTLISEGYAKSDKLAAGEELYLAMVVYMPETVGNVANYGTAKPTIKLGLNVFATQVASETEKDSYGPDYDADAPMYNVLVTNEAELKEALANAKNGDVIGISGKDVTWTTGAGIGSTPFVKPVATVDDDAKDPLTYITLVGVGEDATFTAIGAGVGAIGIDKGTVIFKNLKIADASESYAENSWEYGYLEFRGNTVFENCEIVNAIMMEGDSATFKNCSFNSNKESEYAVWVSDGEVSFENCYFTGTRGIKVHEAYRSEVKSVVINNNRFENLTKKPGLAIGTVNADTTITITNNIFAGTQAGDQGFYSYETDTDVTTFNFTEASNTVAGYAANNKDLKNALANNATVVVPAGKYTFPASDFKANTTLICAEGTVFEGNSGLNINGATVIGGTFSNSSGNAVSGSINGTFKDCTFTGSNALRGCYAGETVVFENCVFSGDVYGVHFDGGANDVIFKNCTLSGFNALAAAIEKVTMENCTFVANGKSGYNGINMWGNTEMTNCTFVFDGTADNEWIDLCSPEKTAKFTNCVVTDGVNTTNIAEVVSKRHDNATIIVDEAIVAHSVDNLDKALANGEKVILVNSLNFSSADTDANSGYGATGVSVKGGVLDGNGNSLGINNWGTWDSAVHTTGGTIKNLTINSGMRGIFMGSATADVYIDNVVIDGTIYTFNSDGGDKNYGVYISNSTLNGWTSHSDVHKEVVYTNCNFGEGNGYAFCRPYGPTAFVGCDFEVGFEIEPLAAVTFENCTIGGVALTAENLSTLVTSNIANASVK